MARTRKTAYEYKYGVKAKTKTIGTQTDLRQIPSHCKEVFYCKKEINKKYKNNALNRRLGRVGKKITRWKITY